MSIDFLDTLIIGGGVTGLATAADLARRGHSVALVERRPRVGMETSTHNSGVIHAGLYYPAGSLKAELCVEGAERLYAYCAQTDVPHDRCGKLVVAAAEKDTPALDAIMRRGSGNGAKGLEIVDAAFIRAREPHVAGVAALWSPNTGRLDAPALVAALRRTAEDHGAMMLTGSAVERGERNGNGFSVALEREAVSVRTVVNAAGLYADAVSDSFGGDQFRIFPVRGEYAELKPSKRHLVNGLVYPLPHESGHGLGVHLTKTPSGAVLLGPTARYQSDKEDYEHDLLSLEDFVEPTRELLPSVTLEDLRYGGTGIRPKLCPPEVKFADFMIRHDSRVPGLVHAAGIESPGLTACLAVATRVAALVEEALA